jgi:Uncharacterised protein family (UPF0236).
MEATCIPNLSMEATCAHNILSFGGLGINFGTKAANREKIHGDMDSWMDEVKMAGGAGLGGIVNEVFKKRQELIGKIVEQLIKEKFSDELNREILVCPNCGRVLNRRDMHERTVQTMIGEITLRRPYFYCENCKEGFHPLDAVLILSDSVKQWDMQEAGASVAAELPYNKAQELFEELTGLSMSDHTMHDTVGNICEEADILDIAPSAEEIEEKVKNVGEGKTWRPIMVLTIDGALVPTRPEDAKGKGKGRKKERAKRAKWNGEWREAKGFRFYLVDGDRIEHVLCWHQVQSSEELKECLRKIKEAGLIPERDIRLCAVGDGARWIWKAIKEIFPDATQVLDYYHASEYIYDAAEGIYDNSEEVQEWAEAMVTRLFVGEIEEVINDLKQANATKEEARSTIDRLLGYLLENKGRMHYKHARKGGYPIGSGGIESSNKTVCHIRLKRSGAWWYKEKANQMLALRCAKYNGTFPRLFRQYMERQKKDT